MLATLAGLSPAGVPATATRDGGSSAPQAEAHVDAREDFFYPSIVTVRRGGTVVWEWPGEQTHTATDETGMALFDSGLVPAGGPSYAYTFAAAGSYPYVCTLHEGMDGRVEVPIRAGETEAGARVTWSTGTAPDGYVYDVQSRRQGRTWRIWLEGATDPSGTFEAGRGSYRFRARLRLTETGAASDWSSPASVKLA